MARPTKMTPEVLDKLRQAYLIGATNDEACGYAGITEKTLYNYIDKVPEFLQQIKSENKTSKALLAGIPVAHDVDELEKYMSHIERNNQKAYTKTRKEYDCKISVQEYEDLIDEIRNNKTK